MSMAAYIRPVLQKNLDALKARKAAVGCRVFLDGNAAGRFRLDEGDRADFSSPPRTPQPYDLERPEQTLALDLANGTRSSARACNPRPDPI